MLPQASVLRILLYLTVMSDRTPTVPGSTPEDRRGVSIDLVEENAHIGGRLQ
jgi:hypothetical protein